MDAQMIAIDRVVESPTNPRRRAAPDDDAQLLESVRAQGVLQPVLAQPTEDGGYELVFGHRRLRAARAAGLLEIPAVVRTMTPDEATEAAVAENAARGDLHPLDEADAFARLRALGRTATEIAARVGKSPVYVGRRLRLVDLAEPVRKLLEEGKLDVPRALLVAPITDPKLQVEAAEEMAEPDWQGDLQSLADCRFIAQQRMRSLARVAWALDDAGLVPSAGACTTCPKRTGAQSSLFDGGAEDDDYCTDGVCFTEKQQAHGDRLLEEAKAKGQRTLSPSDLKGAQRSYDGTPAGYQRIDRACDSDPKRRTYRQLLKKTPDAVVVAKLKDGEVVELVSSKGLAATLRKAGHDFQAEQNAGASPARTSGSPPTNQATGAVKEEQLRRELDAVWNAAREGDVAALLRVVLLANEWSWDDPEEVYKRLGIEKIDGKDKDRFKRQRAALATWAARAPASDLLAALLLGEAAREAWTGKIPDEMASVLGIDRKKIAAELKADLQRLAKASKPAAKKTSARKKAPAKKVAAKRSPKQ